MNTRKNPRNVRTGAVTYGGRLPGAGIVEYVQMRAAANATVANKARTMVPSFTTRRHRLWRGYYGLVPRVMTTRIHLFRAVEKWAGSGGELPSSYCPTLSQAKSFARRGYRSTNSGAVLLKSSAGNQYHSGAMAPPRGRRAWISRLVHIHDTTVVQRAPWASGVTGTHPMD